MNKCFKKDLKLVVSFKVGDNFAALGLDAIVTNFTAVLLFSSYKHIS